MKMNKFKNFFNEFNLIGMRHLVLGTFAVVSFFSFNSYAAFDVDKSLWAGGAYGFEVPTKNGVSQRSIYGITAGAKIGSEFGLGGYYFSSGGADNGAIGMLDTKYYGIEVSYHFEGEARGAYLGLRFGITKVDFGLSPNEVSASPFHTGIIAGYNYMISDSLSIGGDFGYYMVSKGEATSQATGATQSLDGYSTLNFMATLKAWL